MIRRLRERCALTVAIGSADHQGEKRNPFSGAERRAMLRAYLREARIADVRVITVPDGPSMAWALDRLIRKCRPDVLFLSTERRTIAEIAERRVRVVLFRRTGRTSSTRIRDAIAAGSDRWRSLTGPSVVRWIEGHDGVKRVREAYYKVGNGRQGSPMRPSARTTQRPEARRRRAPTSAR